MDSEAIWPGVLPIVTAAFSMVRFPGTATKERPAAVRVCPACAAVAVLPLLSVTCVALSTDKTVVPAGKLALLRTCPGTSPEVVVSVTAADAGATKEAPVTSATLVLGLIKVTAVALSTERMVVPAGKLALFRIMPGTSPVVLVMVTVAEPGGIVAPSKTPLATEPAKVRPAVPCKFKVPELTKVAPV